MAAPTPLHAGRGHDRPHTNPARRNPHCNSTPSRLTDDRFNSTRNFHLLDGHDPRFGHLLALHVTPADDRAQVGQLARAVQAATGESVAVAFVNQGYTGEKPAAAAREHGIELEVVKLPEAKRGFVLMPRRWLVERSFAWATRFRRLVKDYERYASTLGRSASRRLRLHHA